MTITNRFSLDAPLDLVWRFLLDVPKIAHCVPGAQLLEVIDDRTYAGKIGVKLGPIDVGYRGRIHIEEIDEATHTVKAKAEGAEVRGRGGATASVTAAMFTEDGKTVVTLDTELSVSGIVAQFGRSGIIQQVSQHLANRFAECVQQELKAAATSA